MNRITTKIIAGLLLVAGALPASAATFDAASVRVNGTFISKTANVIGLIVRRPGVIEVKFLMPLGNCVATATPKIQGDPLDLDTPSGRFPFFIQTNWTPSSSALPNQNLTRSIFVITHNKLGALAPVNFDLHVACPSR